MLTQSCVVSASALLPVAASGTPSALAAGDPGSTRLVYAIIVGLVVIGVALVALGIWLIRSTRQDPELLAPLERMSDRELRRADPATQLRLLDDVRPPGAEPLRRQAPRPVLDEEFGRSRPPSPLDDLGPPLPGDRADTPSGLSAPDVAGRDRP